MEILIILLLSLIPLGVVYISWFFLKISKKEREMDIETIGRSYKESRVEEVENRPGNIQVIRDIGGERIGVSKNSRMRENILIPEGLNEDEKQLLRDFYDI